jgi:hypothetical protein
MECRHVWPVAFVQNLDKSVLISGGQSLRNFQCNTAMQDC